MASHKPVVMTARGFAELPAGDTLGASNSGTPATTDFVRLSDVVAFLANLPTAQPSTFATPWLFKGVLAITGTALSPMTGAFAPAGYSATSTDNSASAWMLFDQSSAAVRGGSWSATPANGVTETVTFGIPGDLTFSSIKLSPVLGQVGGSPSGFTVSIGETSSTLVQVFSTSGVSWSDGVSQTFPLASIPSGKLIQIALTGAPQSGAAYAIDQITLTPAPTSNGAVANNLLPTLPAVAPVTASGTTQSTAAPLPTNIAVVTTAASGSGVVLSGIPRQEVMSAGANDILVYPLPGAAIWLNGVLYTVNSPILLAVGNHSTFLTVTSASTTPNTIHYEAP